MSDVVCSSEFQQLLADLQLMPQGEQTTEWPVTQLNRMSQAGCWKWNIPKDFGGWGLNAAEILSIYRRLASVSLVSTFILTQRNAACQRIELSKHSTLRTSLLTRMASGELFATVGISHLTTSRQHVGAAAVRVAPAVRGDGCVLQGTVPWATGATQAQLVVTGGTLDDGRQILAAVPTDRLGVTIRPPVELLGLSSSQTGAVDLEHVSIGNEEILHGPVERVMSQTSGGGAGSLGTSALALGTADGIIRELRRESGGRPELEKYLSPLQHEADELSQILHAAVHDESSEQPKLSETLRHRANQLATRSAQFWLASSKGAGYVSGHPAERAVRESLFFLVWSCPQPVLEADLQNLVCLPQRQDR